MTIHRIQANQTEYQTPNDEKNSTLSKISATNEPTSVQIDPTKPQTLNEPARALSEQSIPAQPPSIPPAAATSYKLTTDRCSAEVSGGNLLIFIRGDIFGEQQRVYPLGVNEIIISLNGLVEFRSGGVLYGLAEFTSTTSGRIERKVAVLKETGSLTSGGLTPGSRETQGTSSLVNRDDPGYLHFETFANGQFANYRVSYAAAVSASLQNAETRTATLPPGENPRTLFSPDLNQLAIQTTNPDGTRPVFRYLNDATTPDAYIPDVSDDINNLSLDNDGTLNPNLLGNQTALSWQPIPPPPAPPQTPPNQPPPYTPPVIPPSAPPSQPPASPPTTPLPKAPPAIPVTLPQAPPPPSAPLPPTAPPPPKAPPASPRVPAPSPGPSAPVFSPLPQIQPNPTNPPPLFPNGNFTGIGNRTGDSAVSNALPLGMVLGLSGAALSVILCACIRYGIRKSKGRTGTRQTYPPAEGNAGPTGATRSDSQAHRRSANERFQGIQRFTHVPRRGSNQPLTVTARRVSGSATGGREVRRGLVDLSSAGPEQAPAPASIPVGSSAAEETIDATTLEQISRALDDLPENSAEDAPAGENMQLDGVTPLRNDQASQRRSRTHLVVNRFGGQRSGSGGFSDSRLTWEDTVRISNAQVQAVIEPQVSAPAAADPSNPSDAGQANRLGAAEQRV